jgi:hypothetical protein
MSWKKCKWIVMTSSEIVSQNLPERPEENYEIAEV